MDLKGFMKIAVLAALNKEIDTSAKIILDRNRRKKLTTKIASNIKNLRRISKISKKSKKV